MVTSGTVAQPKDRTRGLQAAVPLAASLLLAGCSSGSSMNPVNWWHHLEGGAIAEQRPPPPGANAPYPNLATVPAQPQPPNRKELNAITAGLVADREHARHEAAAAPLADPSSPNASPALFGVGTAPPPPPPSAEPAAKPAASATLAAATAPPARPAAPQGPPARQPAAPEGPPPPLHINRAPVGSVKSSPLPGPSSYKPSAAGQAMQTAAIPAMPAMPPAPPAVPGAAAAPSAAPAAAPAPAPVPAGAVLVSFAPGSTALPADAAATLKPLVAKRGSASIAVTGHGDAASSDPAAQSAALSLGLARARAVAAALTADGVPASAVQVGAQATGRGATVRLLH